MWSIWGWALSIYYVGLVIWQVWPWTLTNDPTSKRDLRLIVPSVKAMRRHCLHNFRLRKLKKSGLSDIELKPPTLRQIRHWYICFLIRSYGPQYRTRHKSFECWPSKWWGSSSYWNVSVYQVWSKWGEGLSSLGFTCCCRRKTYQHTDRHVQYAPPSNAGLIISHSGYHMPKNTVVRVIRSRPPKMATTQKALGNVS